MYFDSVSEVYGTKGVWGPHCQAGEIEEHQNTGLDSFGNRSTRSLRVGNQEIELESILIADSSGLFL